MAILMIRGNGNFAFTLGKKGSFGVGEIPAKTRSVWGNERLKIYECQTNAIKEELGNGRDKVRTYGARLAWVSGSEDVLES